MKKFYAFGEDKPPIYFREGTSDEIIIQTNVIDKKEYLFPKLNPKTIFDIGANVGVIACILTEIYPDAIIHCFEPVESNFKMLLTNAKERPNLRLHFYGLSSSDRPKVLWPSENDINHGGFSHEIKSDKETIVCKMRPAWDACEEFGAPELIKIDVEGAEYEILTSIPDWAMEKVKWISGELHGIKDFLLLEKLKEKFKIQVQRNFDDIVYHFHAVNRNWTIVEGQIRQLPVP